MSSGGSLDCIAAGTARLSLSTFIILLILSTLLKKKKNGNTIIKCCELGK